MVWKLIADFVTVVHGLWVVAVVSGPLWAWRNLSIRKIHLIMLWATVVFSGIYCPLTVVETSLRMHYDPFRAYGQGFLQHTLGRLASWKVKPEEIAFVIVGWTLIWTILYIFLWVRKKPSSQAH